MSSDPQTANHPPAKPRLLIVTKDDLRHRLFLSLAHQHLKDYWSATLIQQTPQVARYQKFRKKLRLIRRTCFDVIYRLLTVHVPSKFLGKQLPPFGVIFQGSVIDKFEPKGTPDQNLKTQMPDQEPFQLQNAPQSLYTKNPNGKRVQQWLENIDPDLVIIFGGKILKGKWLTLPRLGAINLHYGILPYYRSSNSTQFALMHDRLDRVGATIHYVDAGVDTGPIIHRDCVSTTNFCDLNTLLAAVYKSGFHSLIDCALQSLQQNKRLPSHKTKADDSYYPGKLGSSGVNFAAQMRLERQHQSWPSIQRHQEFCENKIPKRFTILKKPATSKYRNGIYIFLYHGISDPQHMCEWEKAYTQINISRQNFEDHIKYLLSCGMKPLPLSQATQTLRTGMPDAPYFAITFDDAYSNIIHHAEPILTKMGISPTIFVNGAFTEGVPYYRVLCALLNSTGKTAPLANALRKEMPHIDWQNHPEILFEQTKNHYIPYAIEKVIADTYSQHIGDPLLVKCHLSVEQLQALRKKGWEMGNHTWQHMTLSKLLKEQVIDSIERNEIFLKENGLTPIPWLSYPNGLAKHVNSFVEEWLDAHPHVSGVFAGGGVNYCFSRTEWLRLPIGYHNANQFRQYLDHSIIATNLAFSGKISSSQI